jgi:AcrR family transcriptional regulator
MVTRRSSRASTRRRPAQRRALRTVEAILEAVIRILKLEGSGAMTTNRIAEVAGVSIGSLYQYFPDKNAIFAALHRRHLDEVDRLIKAALFEQAASSLEDLVRALIDAMVDSHSGDPELFELLMIQVPHRAGGTQDFAPRLHSVIRLALASRSSELPPGRNLDTATFIVAHMVDSLCHGAVLRRPPELTLAEAKDEAARAVLAYLRSHVVSPVSEVSPVPEEEIKPAKWFLL